jgi:hypothetical protein
MLGLSIRVVNPGRRTLIKSQHAGSFSASVRTALSNTAICSRSCRHAATSVTIDEQGIDPSYERRATRGTGQNSERLEHSPDLVRQTLGHVSGSRPRLPDVHTWLLDH